MSALWTDDELERRDAYAEAVRTTHQELTLAERRFFQSPTNVRLGDLVHCACAYQQAFADAEANRHNRTMAATERIADADAVAAVGPDAGRCAACNAQIPTTDTHCGDCWIDRPD